MINQTTSPTPTVIEATKHSIPELEATAKAALLAAEKAWYALACSIDVGDTRTQAFAVYENVRTARRVG